MGLSPSPPGFWERLPVGSAPSSLCPFRWAAYEPPHGPSSRPPGRSAMGLPANVWARRETHASHRARRPPQEVAQAHLSPHRRPPPPRTSLWVWDWGRPCAFPRLVHDFRSDPITELPLLILVASETENVQTASCLVSQSQPDASLSALQAFCSHSASSSRSSVSDDTTSPL